MDTQLQVLTISFLIIIKFQILMLIKQERPEELYIPIFMYISMSSFTIMNSVWFYVRIVDLWSLEVVDFQK
jgi:hypothetical protein